MVKAVQPFSFRRAREICILFIRSGEGNDPFDQSPSDSVSCRIGKNSGAPNLSTRAADDLLGLFATMKSAKALAPLALTLGHLIVLSSMTW